MNPSATFSAFDLPGDLLDLGNVANFFFQVITEDVVTERVRMTE